MESCQYKGASNGTKFEIIYYSPLVGDTAFCSLGEPEETT